MDKDRAMSGDLARLAGLIQRGKLAEMLR